MPQITRDDALTVVDGLRQLALQHNSRTKSYYAKRIKVFGSILTDKPLLSDVDIAIELDYVMLPGENEQASVKRLQLRNKACLFAERPQNALLTIRRRILYKFEAVSPSISRHSWEALAGYEAGGAASALIFLDEREPHTPLARPRFYDLPSPRPVTTP